jgi:hypothetical protein
LQHLKTYDEFESDETVEEILNACRLQDFRTASTVAHEKSECESDADDVKKQHMDTGDEAPPPPCGWQAMSTADKIDDEVPSSANTTDGDLEATTLSTGARKESEHGSDADDDDDVLSPPYELPAILTDNPFEPDSCCLPANAQAMGVGTCAQDDHESHAEIGVSALVASKSQQTQPTIGFSLASALLYRGLFSCAAVASYQTQIGHHLSAPNPRLCPQTPGDYRNSQDLDAVQDTTAMLLGGDRSGNATGATSYTTVMLRNLPGNYTHDQLETHVLNKLGFQGRYDALYYPKDMKRLNAGSGFAFVNFASRNDAQEFRSKFEKFNDWTGSGCKKAATTNWAEQQGLDCFIERWRNSSVMHSTVAADCKPRLYKDGDKIAFPVPTKKIKRPSVDREQPSKQWRYQQVSSRHEESFPKQWKPQFRNGKIRKSAEQSGL